MKIDFSGFEPSAPLRGESSELFDGISNSPSFHLPNTANVSDDFSVVFTYIQLIGDLSSPNSLTMFTFLSWVFFQFDGFQKEAIQMVKPAKGTTTLAFIFKGGVMVAADSRASMGGYICKPFCSLLSLW